MKKKWWIIFGIIGTILATFFLYIFFMANCDGVRYNFIRVGDKFEETEINHLFEDFLSNQKGYIITNCTLVGYSNIEDHYLEKSLDKHSIIPYAAKISCRENDFDFDFYEIDGKVYFMAEGMGPCGKDPVSIDKGFANIYDYYLEDYYDYRIR